MARDIEAKALLRINMEYEKAQDSCKAQDKRAVDKCMSLQDTPRYDKCLIKAINASTACYKSATSRYEKDLARIQ